MALQQGHMGISMRDSYEISTVYSRFHAVLFFLHLVGFAQQMQTLLGFYIRGALPKIFRRLIRKR